MKKLKNFLKKKIPALAEIKPFIERVLFGPILEHLEFHVVEHCNLNCKGCSHFSNITEEKFTDCTLIEKRLNRINKIFGKVRKIKILGGEPLLHPEITEIIKITRKSVPDTKIMIITNGLLLKSMPDNFFKACVDNKITLEITVYPPAKTHLNNILEKTSKFNVDVVLSPTTFNFCAVLNPLGTSNKTETFLNCTGKFCTILKNDNLYMCSISAYVDYFNKKFNKSISEGKGINIFTNTAKEILRYLKKPETTCQYCTNDLKYFKWATSDNPQPDDWTGKTE